MRYKIYKLKDLTTYISRGITPSYSDDNCGCIVLNQKCIRDNGVTFDYAKYHNLQKKKINEAKYIHSFDILINSTGVGTAGRVGQIDKVNSKIVADSHVTIVRPDVNKCLPQFLGYSLIDKQGYIAGLARGSTGQTEISRNSVEDILIKLPDLETQQKVVRILSALDEKIELNNKQILDFENTALVIFDDMFPKAIFGDRSVGDYICPKRGRSLLSKDAKDGQVPVIAGGLKPAAYHNEANTKAPVITISASGANAGYVALWGMPVWSSDSSFIDETISKNIYFWYVFLRKSQNRIYDSQTGSAQAHIYPKHIEELNISDISNQEITKYNDKVEPIFSSIGFKKKQNETLCQLRDALLPKLMSGEINLDKVAA